MGLDWKKMTKNITKERIGIEEEEREKKRQSNTQTERNKTDREKNRDIG